MKLGKVLGYGLVAVIVLLAVAITFTIGWRPFLGPKTRALTDRQFEATPERLARGDYLVNSVASCFGCHSEVDWKNESIPADKRGGGEMTIDPGAPWLHCSNITPDKETGIGAWSDDAIARAIREGVNKDGRTLFPMMPYAKFRSMSDEDLASVIVYLRTIPAIRRPVPATEAPFPVSRFINAVPEPITDPVPPPDLGTPEKRGQYLVTLAGCDDCHTPRDERGQPRAGLEFGGGTEFMNPLGRVVSVNITPDPSGIPYYTEELFIEAMRTGRVRARKLHPQMPYVIYRNMTDEDLRAMFAFLKTLKPVKHRVDNTTAPTDCPLCKVKHGLGDQNVAPG
jgi:mono/diheme cytochrome c family protein